MAHFATQQTTLQHTHANTHNLARAYNKSHFIFNIKFPKNLAKQQPQTLENVPIAQLKAISWISEKCLHPLHPLSFFVHPYVWPKDIHDALNYADKRPRHSKFPYAGIHIPISHLPSPIPIPAKLFAWGILLDEITSSCHVIKVLHKCR